MSNGSTNDNELRACLASLNKQFDSLKATARTRAEGREGRNVIIEANQHGLLSIASSLLEAAVENSATISEIPDLHCIALNQITREKGDLFLLGAIRHESWTDQDLESCRTGNRADRLWLLGCAMIATVLGLIGVGGILFWVQVLTQD